MSSIVHVQHPAPLRLVPKGGRAERLVFNRVDTPVRLREVSAAELEPMGGLRAFAGYHRRHVVAHGGRLWLKLVGGPKEQPLGRERLVGFLTSPGDPKEVGQWDLHNAFARTPVKAQDGTGWSRGQEVDVASARQVVHDGTERARADLARFLEEDVLLADGEAYVRCLGPVLSRHSLGRPNTVFEAVTFPQALPDLGNPVFRMDRVDEFWAFEKRMGAHDANHHPPFKVDGVVGVYPPEMITDADVLLFANLAPKALEGLVAEPRRQPPLGADPQAMDRVDDLVRGLRPAMDLGTTFSVRPEEAEAVLVLLRSAAAAAVEAYSMMVTENGPLMRILRYCDEVALPRLRSQSDLAPDDADAMRGIAP